MRQLTTFLVLYAITMPIARARAGEHAGDVRPRRSQSPIPVQQVGATATLERCLVCHGSEPLITSHPLLASPEGLVETLREPGRNVDATLRTMVDKARKANKVNFDPVEIAALKAYITGEKPPAPRPPIGMTDLPQLLPAQPDGAPQMGPQPAPSPMPATAAGVGEFLKGNCQQCHTGQIAFPAFVLDSDQFQQRLDRQDPQALTWLKRLNSKVVHGEMLAHAGLKKTEGTGKAFHDQIAGLYHAQIGSKQRPVADDAFGAEGASLMIDSAKREEYRQVLQSANIPDPEVRRELLEFDAMWDATGNPPWSWAPDDGDSFNRGGRPVGREPASPPRPFIFKFAGGRWRWKEPYDSGFAIDSDTKGLKKFVVVRFPRDAAGNILKGDVGTAPSGKILPLLRGRFPVGTKIFEVHYSTKLGKPVAVDIVSRQKRADAGEGPSVWAGDAIRQDSGPEKIRAWVNQQLDRDTNPDYAKILRALDNPQQDAVVSQLGGHGEGGGRPFIVNGQRTGRITGSKSVVSGVSNDTLERMYRELPMESAAGRRGWQLEASDLFSGTHRGVPINTQTCANCHRMSGQAFSDILDDAGLVRGDGYYDQYGRPITQIDSVSAYGNGPGYDGVLSAPWFTPEQLRQYGPNWNTVRMRPEWRKFFK